MMERVLLGVNGYLLNNNTLLKYNGNGVTDKTFDSASEDWNLLGVEKTGTGYQGIWRSSLGSYSLWNTDNLGNYLSSTSGSLADMVAYETAFAQDFKCSKCSLQSKKQISKPKNRGAHGL
ncbi:MAG: hypothetical protein WCO29_01255 [Nostocales cyanobacterium ELA583]